VVPALLKADFGSSGQDGPRSGFGKAPVMADTAGFPVVGRLDIAYVPAAVVCEKVDSSSCGVEATS